MLLGDILVYGYIVMNIFYFVLFLSELELGLVSICVEEDEVLVKFEDLKVYIIFFLFRY